MKVGLRRISDAIHVIGWMLTVFAVTRMCTIASVFDQWKISSEKYYCEEVPSVIPNVYRSPLECKDAVWFSRASEKIVMHDVVRRVGGLRNASVTGPALGVGVFLLIASVCLDKRILTSEGRKLVVAQHGVRPHAAR